MKITVIYTFSAILIFSSLALGKHFPPNRMPSDENSKSCLQIEKDNIKKYSKPPQPDEYLEFKCTFKALYKLNKSKDEKNRYLQINSKEEYNNLINNEIKPLQKISKYDELVKTSLDKSSFEEFINGIANEINEQDNHIYNSLTFDLVNDYISNNKNIEVNYSLLLNLISLDPNLNSITHKMPFYVDYADEALLFGMAFFVAARSSLFFTRTMRAKRAAHINVNTKSKYTSTSKDLAKTRHELIQTSRSSTESAPASKQLSHRLFNFMESKHYTKVVSIAGGLTSPLILKFYRDRFQTNKIDLKKLVGMIQTTRLCEISMRFADLEKEFNVNGVDDKDILKFDQDYWPFVAHLEDKEKRFKNTLIAEIEVIENLPKDWTHLIDTLKKCEQISTDDLADRFEYILNEKSLLFRAKNFSAHKAAKQSRMEIN